METIRVERPRAYPPRVTEFTQRFWQGLDEGNLFTTRCRSCEMLAFPPKPICPHCWADAPNWVEIDSTGTLYSWTRIHASPAQFVPELPYEVGVVDLDDNLRIACRVVLREGNDPVPGDRVELVVLMYEDGPIIGAKLI